MCSVDWDKAEKQDVEIITKIASRALSLMPDNDFINIQMDITACHISGCPLKLQQLLDADNFNFTHDVVGIQNNISRKTGKLQNCFLPRFAQ